MKNDRHLRTAEQYGIKEQCEKLEQELLNIDGVTDIDFDLDGFYDDMWYVIFLAKYEINDYNNYFEDKTRIKRQIIDICTKHDLYPSGDPIEDYGQHLYFVRKCGKVWKTNIKESDFRERIFC